MNVFDNVAFPLREHTDTEDEDLERVVEEALEVVQLPGTGQLMPVDLSGGMRKRVGLARAIVHKPSVILYDEPTTGLDPITADKINELIVDLQHRLHVTSIVVTHDIQSAFYVGDRIAFLRDGTFDWIGTMDEARATKHEMLRDFLVTSNVVSAQPT
jgi:phospholipid/cholesterol/gamma-HCH transport system ATP-binding protein